ncbi:MAG: hypothetical protein JW814_06790 [Candidatus Krumholzibacteriota bacterium]|nr:hypothetical protein [Candidatus Krumholzibacteriota bacterium]
MRIVLISVFLFFAIAIPGTASDRYDPFDSKTTSPDLSPVINGEFVHNIGNLHMNITNWGFVGSMPNSTLPMRDSPSAQYPAGSSVEYLYAAGIWVGAINNGIPYVSTGYPETEFRPTSDPRDTIYRTREGAPGGEHLPSEGADDDKDGRMDEDFLNGYDDDHDGLIDEDFAARGDQMFCCQYEDGLPQIGLIWPEHEPLMIQVRQESFQWGEELFNDFVAVRYTVKNVGLAYLQSIYIGIYADLDAGARDRGTYHMDDQVGYWEGTRCAPKGTAEYPVNVKIAYVYDDNGDEGVTTGYFGIVLLGHTTTKTGFHAPRYPAKNVIAFQTFQGLQPYMHGGEPTNDFERYELLSTSSFDPDTENPGDYRVLISTGPFSYLVAGMSIDVDIAYVAGDSFEDMLDNAAVAQIIYEGCWYDLDGDPTTGIIGRESPVIGPIEDFDPDGCDGIDEKYDLEKGDTMWANSDCWLEMSAYRNLDCYKPYGVTYDYYKTGMDGKEHQLHFITGAAPISPNMRVLGGDHEVSIYWDNLSEIVPDVLSFECDFEGYQIWRADEWHRPLGTSIENGPSHDLWSLLDTRDLVNGLQPDKKFKGAPESGGLEYYPLKNLPDYDKYLESFEMSLTEYPGDPVPCPPGLTKAECDTIESIALYNLGRDGGKLYYKYTDTTAKNGMHYFYSVTAYDHETRNGQPYALGRYNAPSVNFKYVVPLSTAQTSGGYDGDLIYAVPNPVTSESMAPWELGPVNDDPSGLKVELRNLPACRSTLRIFTISGDLVYTKEHDGSAGNGTVSWNLVSRNGQDITSGVYIFAVEPHDGAFKRKIGKFVVIR